MINNIPGKSRSCKGGGQVAYVSASGEEGPQLVETTNTQGGKRGPKTRGKGGKKTGDPPRRMGPH